MIRFKKTSSSPPVFVYFTVHFDDKGGDLNTYPKDFKNQVYLVSYGVEGLTDHVDSEVYDAHEAFEIDKTKMKMLVPLDMNGKKIMNTNFDLKFGDLFKIIKCYARPILRQKRYDADIIKKSDNQPISFSTPIVLHSVNLYNKKKFNSDSLLAIEDRRGLKVLKLLNKINIFDNEIIVFYIYKNGINSIRLIGIGNSQQFDVDIVIMYM